MIGFCNWGDKCLLRGTGWVFNIPVSSEQQDADPVWTP